MSVIIEISPLCSLLGGFDGLTAKLEMMKSHVMNIELMLKTCISALWEPRI